MDSGHGRCSEKYRGPSFQRKEDCLWLPKIKAPPKLTVLPLLPQENLYVGVDVGKFRHVAGFLSRTLLMRHERFEGCPRWAPARELPG